MLDRVAHLPGVPCLLAQATRLGRIAFYHVNFFRSYYLPVLSAEQNDSQSEEINVTD